MNIHEFCQSLSLQLDCVRGALSEEAMAPLRQRVRQFEALHGVVSSTKEAVTKALFQLSVFVVQQSRSLSAPKISETVVPLISAKIRHLAGLVLPPPSDIRSMEVQLQQARKALDVLLEFPDVARAESVQAATSRIFDLEEQLDSARRQSAGSAELQKVGPPQPLCCAGLHNQSNKCYVYACVKGLWASSPFRALVENKAARLEEWQRAEKKDDAPRRMTALYLHRLFLTFDATVPSERIEPEEQVMRELVKEMAHYHPSIAGGKQQDATEFLTWLFEDIMDSREFLFSYVEAKRRPKELTVDFWIPNIDCQERTDGNLFIIQLPDDDKAEVAPQSALETSVVEEILEPESILASENNKERDFEAISAKLSTMSHKVHVTKTKMFCGQEPPCFFVHLWRQIREEEVPVEELKMGLEVSTIQALHLTDEEIKKLWGRTQAVKVPTKVKLSPTLVLHHEDGRHVSYRLKAVVVHAGVAEAGHYSTYLLEDQPQSTTLESAVTRSSLEGVSFVRHDDHRVETVPYSQEVERQLQQQGYILMYDKEG